MLDDRGIQKTSIQVHGACAEDNNYRWIRTWLALNNKGRHASRVTLPQPTSVDPLLIAQLPDHTEVFSSAVVRIHCLKILRT